MKNDERSWRMIFSWAVGIIIFGCYGLFKFLTYCYETENWVYTHMDLIGNIWKVVVVILVSLSIIVSTVDYIKHRHDGEE